MSREIDELIKSAGAYQEQMLIARRDFIRLRLSQDLEISKMFIDFADKMADRLKRLPDSYDGALNRKSLEALESDLRFFGGGLQGDLSGLFKRNIDKGAEIGSKPAKEITKGLVKKADISVGNVDDVFFRVNRLSAEAIWSRTQKGLTLDDRIWDKSEKAQNSIQTILKEAVIGGEDAITTAQISALSPNLSFRVDAQAAQLQALAAMTDTEIEVAAQLAGNVVKPLLEARRNYIEAAIAKLKNDHTSVVGYLTEATASGGLGLSNADIEKLRALYLK